MTQLERAIELYSLYGTPSGVWKKLKEEYEENSYTYDYVRKIRVEQAPAILRKRKKLSESSIRILDPSERWAYLQQIIDDSLGATSNAKDRSVALSALKLADEFAQVRGAMREDEINQDSLVRDIVYDTFEKMKNLPEYKGKTVQDIVEDMRKSDLSTEQVTPFLDEIISNYK